MMMRLQMAVSGLHCKWEKKESGFVLVAIVEEMKQQQRVFRSCTRAGRVDEGHNGRCATFLMRAQRGDVR